VIGLLNDDTPLTALKFSGAADAGRIEYPSYAAIETQPAITVAMLVFVTALTNGRTFARKGSTSGWFLIISGTAGEIRCQVFHDTTSGGAISNTAPLKLNRWQWIGFRYDASAGAGLKYSLFASPDATSRPVQPGYGTRNDPTGPMSADVGTATAIGNSPAATSATPGSVAVYALFNRALSDTEFAEFCANPWRAPSGLEIMYLPGRLGTKSAFDEVTGKRTGTITIASSFPVLDVGPAIGGGVPLRDEPWVDDSWQSLERRWMPLALPAAGGTSVTPGVGALTLTGFAPAVSVSNNQNVAAGVGALALAGFSPTVSVSNNQNVLAGVGAVTATGFAPTVSTPQSVGAGVGALTLSGFAPTVSAGTTIPLGVGALSLSGFAPTISVSSHQNVLAGVGSVLATGFAPTIATPRNVLAGTGALSATGFAPTVFASNALNVPIALGALVMTGFAPAYSSGPAVTLGPGPFTVRARGLNTRTIARAANTTVVVRGANTSVTPREN
jgi:hypothetical protein